MGLNIPDIIKPSFPQRPIYYSESPASPPQNQHPTIQPIDQLKEAGIRAFDPTSRAQRARYAGTPFHQVQRFLTQVIRGRHLETGSRMTNGVRFRLSETSDFGLDYNKARDHELFEDHGHGHERRVMKWISDILNNSSELHIKDRRLIFGLALFGDHDRDQLATEIRNVARKQKGLPEFDPKWTHGPAGGYMELATVKHLAKESGISLKSTKEIAFIASAMIWLHDEPEKLDKSLVQTEIEDGRKPYEKLPDGTHRIFRGDELLQAFEKGVDLLSLRPSQLAEIVWRMKTKDKKGRETEFVTLETPHGLDPVFEKEFTGELSAIALGEYYRLGDKDMEKLDQEPLPLQNINAEFRRGFVIATRIAEFADLLDKVVPASEAALRKLAVGIATKRQFFKRGVIKRVEEEEGNLPPEVDSDAGRADWERRQLHIRIASHEGQKSQSLSESDYVNKLVDSIGISSLIAEKRIGTMIMEGNEGKIEDFVRQTYDNQLLLLSDKLLRKASLVLVSVEQSPQDHISEAIQQLKSNGAQDYAKRLEYLLTKNEALVVNTIDSLRKKPGGIRQYPYEEIEELQNACNYFLRKDYLLTDEQIRAYEEEATTQTDIEYPFSSYYSAGTPENARTIMYHPHQTRRGKQQVAA